MYDLNLAIKRMRTRGKIHNKTKKRYYTLYKILYMKNFPNSYSLKAGRLISIRASLCYHCRANLCYQRANLDYHRTNVGYHRANLGNHIENFGYHIEHFGY